MSLYRHSKARIVDGLVNQCSLCRKGIHSVMTSEALAYRLAAGKTFDVRDYTYDVEVKKSRSEQRQAHRFEPAKKCDLWRVLEPLESSSGDSSGKERKFSCLCADFKKGMNDVIEKAHDIMDKKSGDVNAFLECD